MQTSVPVGSAIARKVYSNALFTVSQRAPTMANLLTGPAPQAGQALSKMRMQTAPDMPIVRCGDLGKGGGDTVQVTLFNIIGGEPAVGSEVVEGRGEKLTFSSMDVVINKLRKAVSAGDEMSQQRTVHDLRSIANAALQGYMPRLEDQLCMVHLLGARGDQVGIDWVVPLASSDRFAAVTINPVVPPTFNRHYNVSANTGAISQFVSGTIDSGNTQSTFYVRLKTIDDLAGLIDDLEFPLQPIKIADDPAKEDEPLYLMLLAPAVYSAFLQDTTTGANIRVMQQNAWNRASYGSKHPLFKGEAYMWRNILVKKMSRSIVFNVGSVIKYYATEAATTTSDSSAVSGVPVYRNVLLGAQALAKAMGRTNGSKFYYDWSEKELDHGDKLEVAASAMAGFKKVRFDVPNVNGTPVPTDHGLIIMDSSAV